MSFSLCDQRRSLLDQEGHLLALGGPGSGKTTIALLKARQVIKISQPGQEVLLLSFSRAAVQQILQRCRDVLTSREHSCIQVQTYHSFCLDLLASHGRLLSGKRARFIFPGEERSQMGRFGAGWKVERERLAKQEGSYCFDLLAPYAADLLEKSVATKNLIADWAPLIIVDEFQDTNEAQWRIVRALASRTTVFCLADPDQCIFTHDPGIDPARITKMETDLSPTVFDFGSENNRSPGAGGILAYANAVLRNTPALTPTQDVRQRSYQRWEMEHVVHTSVVKAFAEARARGAEDPTVAVLARTNSMVARISTVLSAERSLGQATLPAIEHEIAWDPVLPMASAIVIATILEWPNLPEGLAVSATLYAAAEFYRAKGAGARGITALKTAKGLDTVVATLQAGKVPRRGDVSSLITAYNSMLPLTGTPVADWLVARSIVDATFDEVGKQARSLRLFKSGDRLGEALTSLWLASGSYKNAPAVVRRTLDNEMLIDGFKTQSACSLMSLHKSKGKEFDAVVIVEGEYRAAFFQPDEPFPQLASRRLLRVGITRARRHVTLVRFSGTPQLFM